MLKWMVEQLGSAKVPREDNDKLHLVSEGPSTPAVAAPAMRNYWDLSDDEGDDNAGDAADRFRMGELCRALFRGDDCFYDAEIVAVDRPKRRYDVKFIKNGTLQQRTPVEELQRAHIPRQPRRAGRASRPPLLQPGDGCRAVLSGDETFYAATVTKVKGAAAVEVKFVEGPAEGALQTTSMSDVQLTIDEVERRMHAARHGLTAEQLQASSPASGDPAQQSAQTSAQQQQQQQQSSGARKPPDNLWRAARRGDAEAVSRFLFRDHVEVDAAEPAVNGPEGQRTALFYAAQQGHVAVIKRLLQAGAQDVGGHALVGASPAARAFLASYGFGKAGKGARVAVQRHNREHSRRNRGPVEALRVVSGGAHAAAQGDGGSAAGSAASASSNGKAAARAGPRKGMRAKMRALSAATMGSQAPGLAKLMCRRGAGAEGQERALAAEESAEDEYSDDGEYSAITDDEQ